MERTLRGRLFTRGVGLRAAERGGGREGVKTQVHLRKQIPQWMGSSV